MPQHRSYFRNECTWWDPNLPCQPLWVGGVHVGEQCSVGEIPWAGEAAWDAIVHPAHKFLVGDVLVEPMVCMDCSKSRWACGEAEAEKTFFCHHSLAVLSVWYKVVLSRTPEQSAMHAWWITLMESSRSLLMTRPVGFTQENSEAETPLGNCDHQITGCTPVESSVVLEVLVCGWRVRGTTVGPRSTSPPHTFNRRRHGICPVLDGLTPVFINELGATPGPAPAIGNIPGPDGNPWS